MFSKALFKQSCKANGTMWGIITFAVCFMLACVMLISGNGSIGEVKNSIQDTIITKEIEAQMQKRGINYYATAADGFEKFDELFCENAADLLTYLAWLEKSPKQSDYSGDLAAYAAAVSAWQTAEPALKTGCGAAFKNSVSEWLSKAPARADFADDEQYYLAANQWQALSPATAESAAKTAYEFAIYALQDYITDNAKKLGYGEKDSQTQEMLGSVLYCINPNGMFNDFYTESGAPVPEDYDVVTLVARVAEGGVAGYLASDARVNYREERAANLSAVFLAGNMIKSENVNALLEALSTYGVTEQKYYSFGYNYESISHLARTAIITYRGRLAYEIDILNADYESGILSESEYVAALEQTKNELAADISASFLSTLPSTVSSALEEVGKADLYTLIVGSIFYKLAGLLLPIIYMIMASNNLIAGQVDGGSMAYVLCTSVKRVTVVFTQAVFLIGSLFATFALTTVMGCVCLAIVGEEVGLGYGSLILLNLGGFLVLLALSGLCFFTSCVFDRSKRSMAIGGGLSIFALVAAMLGLFGSPVIPSVVRLDSLNYFNYTTIISLFDVISITEGTSAFIWKFIILAVAGLCGYVAGGARFVKKDLPL